MYKTRKLSWSERQTMTIFDHYKIFREFPEDNRKSQSRSPRKIEMSISNIFLVKLIKTDHYQPKIFER